VRRIALLALVLTLTVLAGLASAQTISALDATLSPDRAGRAATLSVEASGASELGETIPDSIVLAVQRGFRFDPRAVATRCSDAQAAAVACPVTSAIGTGTAQLTASGPLVFGGPQTVVATLAGFLSPPHAGEVAGIILELSEPKTHTLRAVRGRLVAKASGRYGYEVRFEGFGSAAPTLPPGITIALDRLTLKLGTHRRALLSGHRRTVSLITNPAHCGAHHAWIGQLRITAAGAEQRRNVAVACR
jgi:hypothetical protein